MTELSDFSAARSATIRDAMATINASGMQMLLLIFAAITGTPLIALPYASKVSDFLSSVGLEPRATVSHTTAGTFLADLDRLWDHRAEQKGLLRDRVPVLMERAREEEAAEARKSGQARKGAMLDRIAEIREALDELEGEVDGMPDRSPPIGPVD